MKHESSSSLQPKPKGKKAKFTQLEDSKLRRLVMLCQPLDWNQIAAQFPNRNLRQVKERWEYYLSPEVNNGPWSPAEDQLLLQKYQELGTKWSVIAKFFDHRTNTNCKNRFLAIQRANQKAQQQAVSSPEVSSSVSSPEQTATLQQSEPIISIDASQFADESTGKIDAVQVVDDQNNFCFDSFDSAQSMYDSYQESFDFADSFSFW